MDETVKVSLEKKLSQFEKYLLLAQVAECYSADKAAVRALRKVTCREIKSLKESCFPMESGDLRQLFESIGGLKDILTKFVKAKRYELYRLAEEQLSEYINRLQKQIADTKELLRLKPGVQETIDSTVSKAIELKNAIGRGVEHLKKTVKDLNSK